MTSKKHTPLRKITDRLFNSNRRALKNTEVRLTANGGETNITIHGNEKKITQMLAEAMIEDHRFNILITVATNLAIEMLNADESVKNILQTTLKNRSHEE